MFNLLRNRRGVALLMAIGILAIMSIIATSFALNMKLELEAASNYLRSVRTQYAAEAGVNKAIADIRSWVKTSSYNSVIYNISTYLYSQQGEITIPGVGTCAITIGRENERVNLNALDETDSAWIGTLTTAGLSNDDIARIIDYRDADSNVTPQILTPTGIQAASGSEANTKNAPYVSLEEVRLVLNNDARFNAIRDNITIYAPIIRGGLVGRYYSDATASFNKDNILNPIYCLSYYRGKVIELGKIREMFLPGAEWKIPGEEEYTRGWVESHDAEWAGGYLVNTGFGSDWLAGLNRFGVIFTGFIYIPENMVGQVITFYKRSDDGMKLFIDGGDAIINDWTVDHKMEWPVPGMSGTRTFASGGWHPIRIEYYENTGENGLELRWDVGGTVTNPYPYIPAEYFGYYRYPYFDTYNSAGVYRITSTGRVTAADGTILAEKRITAVAKIFGTWTQTKREEFYASWFSELNNFSDGEIKNVTWMNSCPVNASVDLEAGGFTTTPDSLKLGYWDNFDEDVAYSVVNLRGDQTEYIYDKSATSYGWGESTVPEVSFTEFGNFDADGPGNELKMATDAKRNKRYRLNENYYYSDASSGYDLFIRAWEKDRDAPTQRRTNRLTDPVTGDPLPALYENAWIVGVLMPKAPCYGSSDWPPGQGEPWHYRILLCDGDNWLSYYIDRFEVWRKDPSGTWDGVGVWIDGIYANSKVLAMIGVGTNNRGFLKKGASSYATNIIGGSSSLAGAVKFFIWNIWFADEVQKPTIETYWGNYWNGTWHHYASGTANEVYFDNVRFIPQKGYFVSTPFAAALTPESTNIDWGVISWSYESVPNTSIAMSVRAGDSLPTTDTGWTSVSNGSALAVTGKQIQYKAELSTSALNTADYTASGVTPILKDVTITYLPQVEFVFWKEETK